MSERARRAVAARSPHPESARHWVSLRGEAVSEGAVCSVATSACEEEVAVRYHAARVCIRRVCEVPRVRRRARCAPDGGPASCARALHDALSCCPVSQRRREAAAKQHGTRHERPHVHVLHCMALTRMSNCTARTAKSAKKKKKARRVQRAVA